MVFFYYLKKIFYFCIAIINYRNTIIIKDEKEIDSFMEERDRYASRKEKKRQIGSIIGMLIMMAILVFANLGGTWSVLRITLLVIGVTGVIGSAIYRIIHILRG